MLSPNLIHALLSGESRTWSASLGRSVLGLLEFPVDWYVSRRNLAFDLRRAPVFSVPRPVISVGNLTAGGTGKTPLVAWLARHLNSLGKQVVLLSRGYGSKAGQPNDEALELAALLPGVPHLQHRDRVRIARQAVRDYPGSVLVLDDGFQHRRLKRDLDIVLLDATNPFGYGHLLPRGLLREPVESLKRAGVILLTRSDHVDEGCRNQIRERVQAIAPQAVWGETMHVPVTLVGTSGERSELEMLRGERVAVFCGIGNPAAFRTTLEQLGAEIVMWKPFPDHFAYRQRDFDVLLSLAKQNNVRMLICTRKDLVKLGSLPGTTVPVRALAVELSFSAGEKETGDRIRSILPPEGFR